MDDQFDYCANSQLLSGLCHSVSVVLSYRSSSEFVWLICWCAYCIYCWWL